MFARISFIAALLLLVMPAVCAAKDNGKDGKKKSEEPSALDLYLQQALKQSAPPAQPTAGSLWSPSSRLTLAGADVRASQVDDIVTVVVNESASGTANGTTKTSRASAASSKITALAGPKSANGAAQNLLNLTGSQTLDGQGTTTRGATLTATLGARVTHVLPNGYLVLEGSKDVLINSEHQVLTLRGVIRPADLSTANEISSNQIAQMEIKINGKGVVNDAVHRPNILYRILLGILPF